MRDLLEIFIQRNRLNCFRKRRRNKVNNSVLKPEASWSNVLGKAISQRTEWRELEVLSKSTSFRSNFGIKGTRVK